MWEVAVHLAVACNVYGVFFVLFFFPRGVLDEILNLIESVSEGFPSYFYPLDDETFSNGSTLKGKRS